MGCLLRLITVMLLTLGALLWFGFLGALYEKMLHPGQKNLNTKHLFWLGLGLFFSPPLLTGVFAPNESPAAQKMLNSQVTANAGSGQLAHRRLLLPHE